jgi:predicted aspartyl protease
MIPFLQPDGYGRNFFVFHSHIRRIMSEEMGAFRTLVAIENPLRRGNRRELPATLVDTRAELTWAPTAVLEELGIARQKRLGFRTADGRAVFRDIGYAIVHAGGTETVDEVVFAEPGDTILLGARSLEGLNLRVDPRSKQLVDAGAIDAAVA